MNNENKLIAISNEEYRKSDYVSRSDLALLLKNPNDFWNVRYNNKVLEKTSAMAIGIELHAFLEGKELAHLEVLPSTEQGQIRIEGGKLQASVS